MAEAFPRPRGISAPKKEKIDNRLR